MVTLPEAFLYMKVGRHAGEDFESILERKGKEKLQAGCTFWGYGGTACHPLMQVQPFARLYVKKQNHLYLLMEPIDSKADPDVEPAQEYSADGADWKPIPDGIDVTGSRYALVLGEIQPVDYRVPLDDYAVGIGPSRGKSARDYLRGRVDKGCLVRRAEASIPAGPLGTAHLKYAAKLIEPYAVLLR